MSVRSVFQYTDLSLRLMRTYLRKAVVVLVALTTLLGSGSPILTQAAPLSSPPAQHTVIKQVSIDDNGVIAYIKSDGIYTFGRAGGILRQIALGTEAPRSGGRFAQFVDIDSATVTTTLLGEELQIVFRALIEGGSVGEGIFLFSERRGIDAIALPGDIAPNTGGGSFSGFPGQVLISRNGTIMFKATVTGGTASEGLFFVPRGFLLGEAEIDAVAVQGDGAPETGAGAYVSFGAYDLVEDVVTPFPILGLKLDRFAFIANVEGGRVGQGVFLSTFIVASLFPLRLELLTNAVALVGGRAGGLRENTYTSFEDVVLTEREVVFRAGLTGGTAAEGIFQTALLAGGFIELATPKVVAGSQAPVVGARVNYVRFGRMVGNDAEQLIFVADLAGNGPSQALFMVTLGPLTLTSETVSVGDRIPREPEASYKAIGPIAINNDGFIVFQADIEGGRCKEGVFRSLARQDRMIDCIPR